MNDLDDRLTDLLARSAAAVDVQPDLDAVHDGSEPTAPLVDLGRRPQDTRRLLALAAAVLVVVAVAAVGVLVAGDDEGDRLDVAAAPPSGDAAYPVLEVIPDGIDGTVAATDVEEVMATDEPAASPRARAVVGQIADDGSVDDLVLVEVGLSQGADAGEAQVVITGDGLRPGDVVAGVDDGGLPTLELAAVPRGYEVLVPPGPSPAPPAHQAAVFGEPAEPGDDGGIPASVTVTTGGDVPLVELAGAGGAEPVDVGGRPGWQVLGVDGGLVAWTAENGTNVVVEVHGLGPDDDLAVARGVRLVDVDEWLATYDGPDVTGTAEGSATTDADAVRSPLLGHTPPTVPGLDDWADVIGPGGTIVTVARDVACAGCLDQVRAVAEVVRSRPGVHGLLLVHDSGPEPDDVLIPAADALDVLSSLAVDQAVLDAWVVDVMPTTFVLRPDGRVAFVVQQATASELAVALGAAG